jgi:L-2-hydroxyglutarate oxidase LhgO
MADFEVNIVVIGAGVVGLAISKEISESGKEVLIIENHDKFGQITSSRNSGVIHAGIYYPEHSLKSKMCVEGNRLLYEYCQKFSIPHRNTKKLLVASSDDQVEIIDKIKSQAIKNKVDGIKKLSQSKVATLEPLIKCKEALLVDSSGIIDPIAFMSSLEGQIKDNKGMIAYNSKAIKINYDGNFFNLSILDRQKNTIKIKCKYLINSAGLYASDLASKIEELDKELIPQTYFAKGNYFSISKDLGIRHLIYPIPDDIGLGIHLTLELNNTVKFGPDAEWTKDKQDYQVNINKKEMFGKEILKYLPSLDLSLLTPSYSGIRPIMSKEDKSLRDFIVDTFKNNKINGLINLYGIESPGLTSSLSLAKYIKRLLL